MKNKFKKIFFVFISIISLSFYNVSAFSISSLATGLTVAGLTVGNFVICNSDSSHQCSQFDVSSYDKRLSIFDPLAVTPICNTRYTVRYDYSVDEYFVLNDNWSGLQNVTTLCDSGVSPSKEKILEYFPYVIRFNYNYTWNNNNDLHYMYYFFDKIPELEISTNRISFSNVKFVMTNVPDNYLLNENDNTYANDKMLYYYNGTYDYLTYYSTRDNLTYGSYGRQDFPTLFLTNLNYNAFFDVTLSANFDLSLIQNGNYNLSNVINNFSSNLVDDFEFNTDVNLSLNSKEFVLLIPKKNSAFNGYFWTDSNFGFSYDFYNSLDNTFTNIDVGELDDIAFNALNEYPWFRWDYSFSNDDISNNRVLAIYNHNDNRVLNIKFFSSDFYYNVYDEKSGSAIINGIEYVNNWNTLHDKFKNSSINNVYELRDDTNSINFIKNLPNLLNSFVSSFAFIGTLFTTFFSIFTGELQIYFYVLFGFMIIMLLINIMK